MLWLFVALHVSAAGELLHREEMCLWYCWLWTRFSPSVADYETKGFTTSRQSTAPFEMDPVTTIQQWLLPYTKGLESFPPRWNAALSLGSQMARNLSIDGRMGVNAGEGDAVWQNAHHRGESPSLGPTDISF